MSTDTSVLSATLTSAEEVGAFSTDHEVQLGTCLLEQLVLEVGTSIVLVCRLRKPKSNPCLSHQSIAVGSSQYFVIV